MGSVPPTSSSENGGAGAIKVSGSSERPGSRARATWLSESDVTADSESELAAGCGSEEVATASAVETVGIASEAGADCASGWVLASVFGSCSAGVNADGGAKGCGPGAAAPRGLDKP